MATANMYGSFIQKAFNKEVNWLTDTVKVMLTTSSYTPDQDAHAYKSSITNEVTGTGYAAGGITLSNKVSTYTAGTNKIKLSADPVTWANSTITARYAVIYVDTGVAGASPLCGYVDFGSNQVSTLANFTLTWDANGIFEITVA